jgi:DNA-binding MarR family transcriptional regulator
MITSDTELSLMESLGEAERAQARITQRELASRAGLSLGMTNALLRRFAEKGWVKLTHLSAKSVQYALTKEGVVEVARRTAGYFRRAARTTDQYRARIERFVRRAKREGATTLVLAGTSELDFLLEFVCERHGLVFVRTADEERARAISRRHGVVLIYTETGSQRGNTKETPFSGYLWEIIGQ